MSLSPEELDRLLDVPIRFGLRAQGHLPTIDRMLAEGASWEAIGFEIGWDPETAERFYDQERATPVSSAEPEQ